MQEFAGGDGGGPGIGAAALEAPAAGTRTSACVN
jgi:hypothetical protein